MDIDEYFDRKHNYGRKHHGHHYDDDHEYVDTRYYGRHGDKEVLFRIFDRIRNNPKLKLLVLIAALLILAILIALIIILLPLLTKIINYVTQNGLQGIIDKIMSFVDTILKGTSNGPTTLF
jgi:type IV secretory pathway component VirB8